MPAPRPSSSPAAACATTRSSRPPTRAASPCCLPAYATSGLDMKRLVIGPGGREQALACTRAPMPGPRTSSSPAAACATTRSSRPPTRAASPCCLPASATSGIDMKLLVIGSGGREHAIAWKLAQSPRIQVVYVAPGNGGTATENGLENVPVAGVAELVAFAKKENIHVTVVGPEAALAAGVVDAFRDTGLKIFGPTRAAAQLESSKDFAKSFMVKHRIPTALHHTFASAAPAKDFVSQRGAPIVVKADGLAAGKGVVVATSIAEAHDAIDRLMNDKALGEAGSRVVIEEFLAGEEASFIVM